MVHIDEISNKDNTITIRMDGRLDSSSVPTIENICQDYLKKQQKIYVDLQGLYSICRDGKAFLDRIKYKVILQNVPAFIRLDN